MANIFALYDKGLGDRTVRRHVSAHPLTALPSRHYSSVPLLDKRLFNSKLPLASPCLGLVLCPVGHILF